MSFDTTAMHLRTRKWTNLVADAVHNGLLDPKDIVTMCLVYMSEDDVKDMCRANDLQNLDGNEDEE